MPETNFKEVNIPILRGCPLTEPYRKSDPAGLTPDMINIMIASNEYAQAVIDNAGGIAKFIELTDGGKMNPEDWPFKIPTREEVWPPKPAPEKPEGRIILEGPPPCGPDEIMISTGVGYYPVKKSAIKIAQLTVEQFQIVMAQVLADCLGIEKTD